MQICHMSAASVLILFNLTVPLSPTLHSLDSLSLFEQCRNLHRKFSHTSVLPLTVQFDEFAATVKDNDFVVRRVVVVVVVAPLASFLSRTCVRPFVLGRSRPRIAL